MLFFISGFLLSSGVRWIDWDAGTEGWWLVVVDDAV